VNLTLGRGYFWCGIKPETPVQPARDEETSRRTYDSYPCAANEAGPEVAYKFLGTADQDVTVFLRRYAPNKSNAPLVDKDLDLIVLDATCTATSTCLNQMVGGALQGVTAGTGYESVTFHSAVNHTYYLVSTRKT